VTTSPAECEFAQFPQQISDYTATRSTFTDDGSNYFMAAPPVGAKPP